MGLIAGAITALGFGVKRVGTKVTELSEQLTTTSAQHNESRTREANEARDNTNRLTEAILRLGDRYEAVSTRSADRTEALLSKILDSQGP